MRKTPPDCEICNDLGFVRSTGDTVHPCPACNPDSDFDEEKFQRNLIKLHGRCDWVKGGGGRVCIYYKGVKVLD